jgi:hypothetical protein
VIKRRFAQLVVGAAALVGSSAVAIVRADDVEHVPGAPHPTANLAADAGNCPLYFVEFSQQLQSGRLVLSGQVANAGPGTARQVTVEAHAFGKDDRELDHHSTSADPGDVAPGTSSRFSVEIPIRDWEREHSDTSFDHSLVEEHVARCDSGDPDPADRLGSTRSSYRRQVFAATEELTLLGHRIESTRGGIHSAIIRNQRAAYRDLPEMQRRTGELNDLLTRELPERAAAAGAPPEWVRGPR